MAKQFPDSTAFLVSGGLLNRYEQAADEARGNKAVSAQQTPDSRPWLTSVSNTTSNVLRAGAAVGRKAILTEPSDISATPDSPHEWFAIPPRYEVEPYDESKHHGDFLILLDDLSQDENGKAAVHGEIKVTVNIIDPDHEYAVIPESGNGSRLESAPGGPCRIIYCPTDEQGDKRTGEQLCTVRFPVAQGGGGSIQLVQVKSVNTSAATVTVSPVKLEPENTPNYSSPASPTRTAYYLRS